MTSFTVKGMHCKSCSMLIQEELEDLGVTNVSITVDDATQTGTVNFETDKDTAELKAAIEALGEYKVSYED
ncbi:heavy-metal-associated domain-containing protein [Candidatus Woesearchaeota archaeon]|nr:heavy-metal-associated domain-containing protein [Candidatus Woesearchaeota archaeon]